MKTVNKKLGPLLETVEYNQQKVKEVMKKVIELLYTEDDHSLTLHVGNHGIAHIERFMKVEVPTKRGILDGVRQVEIIGRSHKEFTVYNMIGDCILVLLVNPEIVVEEESYEERV